MTVLLTTTDDAIVIPGRVKIGLAIVALAVFGLICYGIGTNRGASTHVLTGRAYTGGQSSASVKVDGWMYGFDIRSVDWYDSHGDRYSGTVAPCLGRPGNVWIRFGWAQATDLHDAPSERVVTWVQCMDKGGQGGS